MRGYEKVAFGGGGCRTCAYNTHIPSPPCGSTVLRAYHGHWKGLGVVSMWSLGALDGYGTLRGAGVKHENVFTAEDKWDDRW